MLIPAFRYRRRSYSTNFEAGTLALPGHTLLRMKPRFLAEDFGAPLLDLHL